VIQKSDVDLVVCLRVLAVLYWGAAELRWVSSGVSRKRPSFSSCRLHCCRWFRFFLCVGCGGISQRRSPARCLAHETFDAGPNEFRVFSPILIKDDQAIANMTGALAQEQTSDVSSCPLCSGRRAVRVFGDAISGRDTRETSGESDQFRARWQSVSVDDRGADFPLIMFGCYMGPVAAVRRGIGISQ
jgi:hypothetical protein